MIKTIIEMLIKKSVLATWFHKVPGPLINNLFLMFPFIYKTNLINYETGINPTQVNDLKEAINDTKNLKGEIIECGSNRCGTTAILGMHLKEKNINKKIYALDNSIIATKQLKILKEERRQLENNSIRTTRNR